MPPFGSLKVRPRSVAAVGSGYHPSPAGGTIRPMNGLSWFIGPLPAPGLPSTDDTGVRDNSDLHPAFRRLTRGGGTPTRPMSSSIPTEPAASESIPAVPESPAAWVGAEPAEAVSDPDAAVPTGAVTPPVTAPAPAPAVLSPAECAARLAQMFPALFAGAPKPIKLRIHADIQLRAPGIFTRRVLSVVLARHTTTTPYLKALAAQPQRLDLDGQPAGEISEEHRKAAVEELARRRQVAEARRAEERAARARQQPPVQAPAGAADPAAGDTRPRPPARPPRRQPPPSRGAPRPNRPVPGPGGRAAPRPPRPSAPPVAAAMPAAAPRQTRPPAQSPAIPDDPAQRERAQLLRAWESSPLSKANFCALKRLREADFDAQIALAQRERGAPRAR